MFTTAPTWRILQKCWIKGCNPSDKGVHPYQKGFTFSLPPTVFGKPLAFAGGLFYIPTHEASKTSTRTAFTPSA